MDYFRVTTKIIVMIKEQQRNHLFLKNSLGYNFVLQCFYLQKWAVFLW